MKWIRNNEQEREREKKTDREIRTEREIKTRDSELEGVQEPDTSHYPVLR